MTSRSSKFLLPIGLMIGLLLALPGCSRDGKEQKAEKAPTSGLAPNVPVTPPGVELATVKGKVLEVAEAEGFVFLLIDRGDEQIWATVPAVKVEPGEEVTLLDANIFNRFYSKSLDRSFEKLVFASGIKGKNETSRVASSDKTGESGTESGARRSFGRR